MSVTDPWQRSTPETALKICCLVSADSGRSLAHIQSISRYVEVLCRPYVFECLIILHLVYCKRNWHVDSEEQPSHYTWLRNSVKLLYLCEWLLRTLTWNGFELQVVSYDFKEYRFANLHRSALQFPASRFFFKGTPSAPSSILAAQQGELRVQGNFERDPYGCEGSLRMKRLTRDPFLRTVPYPAGCPELKGLFSYCGTQPYSRRLPWHN